MNDTTNVTSVTSQLSFSLSLSAYGGPEMEFSQKIDPFARLDLQKICRACLQQHRTMNDLSDTIGSVQIPLKELLSSCSKISINNTGMPHRLCTECTKQLMSAYSFKVKCEESDKILIDYLIKLSEMVVKPETHHEDVPVENDLKDPIAIKTEVVDMFEMNFVTEESPAEDDFFNNAGQISDHDMGLPSENEIDQLSDKKEPEPEPEPDHNENDVDRKSDAFPDVNLGHDYSPLDDSDSDYEEPKPKRKRARKRKEKDPRVTVSFTDEIERDENNRFQCEVCKKYYNHKKTVIRHMNNLHGATISNRCKVCGKVFAKGIQLEAHMDSHNKSLLICEVCDAELPSLDALKKHKTNHMVGKATKPIKSEKIKFELNVVHKTLCQPNGLKNIFCKICSMRLPSISKLRTHLRDHTSKVSFLDCQFDKEFLKNMGLCDDLSHEEIVDEIVGRTRLGNFSNCYSIATVHGNELSISDSETELDNDDEDGGNKTATTDPPAFEQYKCDLCSKIFNRRYKILKHQKDSHKFVDLCHQCSECKWKFASDKLLEHHQKSQCSNTHKKLSCADCSMKFSWGANLLVHQSTQHADKKFVCPICNKNFSRREHVKRHMSVHTATRRFPCETCQKVFTRNEHLERHKAIHSPSRHYPCPICNKSFIRPEHLERHKSIHLPSTNEFECEKCHKKFNRRDNLRAHMRTHIPKQDREEKAFIHLCVYCGRRFANSSNLIVHMRRHTGEKPYKCDLCDKSFPRSSDLSCHRLTHTGEKPHLCTVCGKGFSRSNKLVRHQRIHTGVRPYKCTYCDRAFTQSNDLTLHVRRHTGDKPYVCGICGERFIQGTALQSHRRMRGHYEDQESDAPFASISVNNPNRYNSIYRVTPVSDGPVSLGEVKRRTSRKSTIVLSADSNMSNNESLNADVMPIPAAVNPYFEAPPPADVDYDAQTEAAMKPQTEPKDEATYKAQIEATYKAEAEAFYRAQAHADAVYKAQAGSSYEAHSSQSANQ